MQQFPSFLNHIVTATKKEKYTRFCGRYCYGTEQGYCISWPCYYSSVASRAWSKGRRDRLMWALGLNSMVERSFRKWQC